MDRAGRKSGLFSRIKTSQKVNPNPIFKTLRLKGGKMENNKLSRREFMALSGGALVQIGLPGAFVKLSHAENADLASQLRPDGRLRIPPGQMAGNSVETPYGRCRCYRTGCLCNF